MKSIRSLGLLFVATCEHLGLQVRGIEEPGGAIAIFSSTQPRPFSGYFERVQSVYQEVIPDNKNPNECPSVDQVIESGSEEIRASGCFEEPSVPRYSWSLDFSRDAYLKLLSTYSFYLTMDESRRKRLFTSLARRTDEEYGGGITYPHLSVLHFAKKKSALNGSEYRG
jgi:hypothetical protein